MYRFNIRMPIILACCLLLSACFVRDDSSQVSLKTQTGETAIIETDSGTFIFVKNIPNPDPTNSPTGIAFNEGFFDFQINGIERGGSVNVTITLPVGSSPHSYYKYHDNSFQAFPFNGTEGASISGNIVTLKLVDGGIGDADGLVNGSILDPGAPASDPQADTTPNAFTFVDQFNVSQDTVITSSPVTINGINAPATINVSGGEYSISCNGTFTSSSGNINNGETVCVRHTSASTPGVKVTTLLSVGGITDGFSSTTSNSTGGSDTTPDAFSFIDQSIVTPNSEITSNTLTITGINAPAAVSVNGGEYSIGCGNTFTADAGTISNDETICVRHTSASTAETETTTTLTIGGVSDDFTSTTAADENGEYHVRGTISGVPSTQSIGTWKLFVNSTEVDQGPISNGAVTFNSDPIPENTSYFFQREVDYGFKCSQPKGSGFISTASVNDADITCESLEPGDIILVAENVPTGPGVGYELSLDGGAPITGTLTAANSPLTAVTDVPSRTPYTIAITTLPERTVCSLSRDSGSIPQSTTSPNDVEITVNCQTFAEGLSRASSGPEGITKVEFGNGKFVAYGTDNQMWHSTDGDNWTLASQQPTKAIHLFFDGAKFVAVNPPAGAGGVISTSSDGDIWTTLAGNTTISLMKAVGGKVGQYVGVDNSNTYQSTDLVNWTKTDNGDTTPDFATKVIHNGSRFVALGDEGVSYSDDNGDSWSIVNAPLLKSRRTLWDGIWHNNHFYAASSDGALSSPDASGWIAHDSSFTHGIAENGDGVIAAVETAGLRIGTPGTRRTLLDGIGSTVIAGGNSIFVIGGDDHLLFGTPNTAAGTEDAVLTTDWEPIRPRPDHRDLNRVIWTGSKFVAVGDDNLMLNSDDGTNWQQGIKVFHNENLGDIAAGMTADGKTHFIATGNGRLFHSKDADVWGRLNTVSTVTELLFDNVNQQFSAHSSFHNTYFVSTNGTSFVDQEGDTKAYTDALKTNGSKTIAYNGSTFYRIDSKTSYSTSSDGMNWTSASYNGFLEDTPEAVIYDSGTSKFIFVGRNGFVATSDDFSTWVQSRGHCGGYDLNDIAYDGTRYVTVGSNGAICTTADTANLFTTSSFSSATTERNGFNIRDVLGNGDELLAVGHRDIYDGDPNFPRSVPVLASSQDDGETWQEFTLPEVHDFQTIDAVALTGIQHNGSVYVATGTGIEHPDVPVSNHREDNRVLIFTSPDAETWTLQEPGIFGDTFDLQVAGDTFFLVTTDPTSAFSIPPIRYSTDGINWVDLTNLPFSPSKVQGKLQPVSFAHDGTQFLYGGQTKDVYTTTDFETYTKHGQTKVAIRKLRFIDGQYFTNGIESSSDLQTWSVVSTAPSDKINDIVKANNRFFAVGLSGNLLVTPPNSLDFIETNYVPTGNFGRILGDEDIWEEVIVNTNGVFVRSGDVLLKYAPQ